MASTRTPKGGKDNGMIVNTVGKFSKAEQSLVIHSFTTLLIYHNEGYALKSLIRMTVISHLPCISDFKTCVSPPHY